MRFRTRGFTLVELLVVIGIIAVLVGILLPSLQAARRAANTVKCASSMREIGNAFAFYVNENKGWMPPTKTGGVSYTIAYPNYIPPTSVTSSSQYWWAFLARYTTRKIMGQTGATGDQRNDGALNNVLWGCPAFQPYFDSGFLGNLNPADTGYGMNAFPEYTATYPPIAGPPNTLADFGDTKASPKYGPTSWRAISIPGATGNWTNITSGNWYKANQYKNPAERCLVADGQFWLLEVEAAPLDGSFPGQKAFSDWTTWADNSGSDGEALYDFYRHGRYPPADTIAASGSSGGSVGRFKSIGGKVAFNILYCDGHVVTAVDRAEGYRAARMRYPG